MKSLLDLLNSGATIGVVPANMRGRPIGDAHPQCEYSDAQVARRARALRAEGWTYREIVEMTGVSDGVIYAAVHGKGRPAAVRYVVRKAKHPLTGSKP